MIVSCEATPCPVILSATCVFYKGENLIYTGINMNDNLQTALEKIDGKFQDVGLGYIFENGIIQLSPGQPVRLGGSLMQNTTINSAGYTFTISGSIQSGAHITTGGTSSQFVKGDGSLDSTTYQPAGSYITGLTGDGIASGPGNVPLTLATVNANPGTYGNGVTVPVVTVNAKGLVTNITPIAISIPADSIVLVGDVSAVGVTGTNITATLATVNSNVYGSNTFLKFAVNAKGLVTSATPVVLGDITSVLGFMPVPDSRTLTINGSTKDLTADRTWNVGTVTSVQASVPPAFSVTSAPITSSGTINIVANGDTSQYIRGDGALATFPAVTSGSAGSSGSSGTSGTDGTSGSSGTSGSNGSSGSSGSSGTNGSSGSSGSSGTNGSGGTSGTSGTDGTSGTNGSSGTSGTNGSSGTSGSNGSSGTSGTDGTSGTSGTNGSGGTSGSSGSSGVNGSFFGSSGTSGSSGVNGADGTNGTSGTSGVNGGIGPNGTNGTSGTSGVDGTNGTSGTSGTGFNTVANAADNRVLTSDGTTNAAYAETNLTFNGTALTVTGYAYFPQNPVGTTYGSGVSTDPLYFIGGLVGDSDQWRIYAESSSTNNSNLILQIEDDIDGSETIRFRHKKTLPAYNAVDTLISNYDGITTNVSVTVNGQIAATGDVIAFSSDRRLKDNIKPISSALDKVLLLNGVTFDWNDKAIELGLQPRIKEHDAGVIAQEVEKVLPQAVALAPFDYTDGKPTSKSGENYLTVKYEKIVPLLIEAIKEQQAQIEQLKLRLDGITK